MNDFAMYHSGSPILYYASECRGLWVCTDELHFNDLVADRIKGVSPWWKRVMWEYKNYGVHKTIATHTLQAQTKTLLLLSSLESGILNPKSLIPNQSNVRTPNFTPFVLDGRSKSRPAR